MGVGTVWRWGKHCLLCFCLIFLCGLAEEAKGAYQISLNAGWNLISLPEQQTSTSITAVTASIEGKFTCIWSYTDGHWFYYSPTDQGFNDLYGMDAGQAYWIHMAEPGVLVGAGLKASSTVSLQSGWNFIGYNSNSERNIVEVLADTAANIRTVWGYFDEDWKVYFPANPQFSDSDFQTLLPGQGYWIDASSSSSLSVELDIPVSTIILNTATGITIVSVTANQVTVEGERSLIESLNIGDVIVSEPLSQIVPDGFLRKIMAIEFTPDGAVLTTVDTTLNEAIQNGAVGATVAYSYQNVDMARSSLAPGFRLAHPSSFSSNSDVSLQVSYEHDLGDGRKITFEGEVTFSPQFLINIEMENWAAKEFTCTFTGSMDSNVEVSASQEIELLDWERDVPHTNIKFTPITFWIGWVPIVFTPELHIVIGANGTVSVNVSPTVGSRASCTAGVGYTQGSGWRYIKNFQFDFYHDLNSVDFEASAKAWLGPKLDVFVYGLAGPYIKTDVFGEIQCTIPVTDIEEVNADQSLAIYAGCELEIGVSGNNQLGIPDAPGEFSVQLARFRIYPEANGFIAGEVVDAQGPLAGVTVAAIGGGGGEYAAETDSNGLYSIELPPGYYNRLEFSKTSYTPQIVYDITVQAESTYSVPQVHLSATNETGSFGGTIANAYTGQPVPNLQIYFRSGINTISGGIVAVSSTVDNGTYLVQDFAPGYYTGEINGTGFITGYFTALCISGTTNENQNGSISPVLDQSQIRMVLTWDQSPSDLDSHLTGPIENSTNRFHVYYSSMGYSESSPYATLDHDDVTSYGPETVTIYQQLNGIYRYSVHDYSNRSSTTSCALSQSSAHVAIYRGNVLWREYNVPNQCGTLWTVFEVNGNALTDVNTMEFVSNPSGVQRTINSQTDSRQTDADLMNHLPSKD